MNDVVFNSIAFLIIVFILISIAFVAHGLLVSGETVKQSMKQAIVVFAVIVGIFFLSAISGCSATTKGHMIPLELDERMLKPCEKELPKLESAEDVKILQWKKAMLGLYARCANEKNEVVQAIREFNDRIAEQNKKIEKAVK
jgi:hypothetical protein